MSMSDKQEMIDDGRPRHHHVTNITEFRISIDNQSKTLKGNKGKQKKKKIYFLTILLFYCIIFNYLKFKLYKGD